MELVTIYGTKKCVLIGMSSFLAFCIQQLHTTNAKIIYLFGILSAAARKAIKKKWLMPDTPSTEDWYDIIYEIFVMENLTFSMTFQEFKFEEIWVTWKMYCMFP